MFYKNIFKFIAFTLFFLVGILMLSDLCHSISMTESALVINEIVAKDIDGGNDWIELYVTGNETIYLGDYSLVDDTDGREQSMLPEINLMPNEFIVIQATDEVPDDGSFYVPFKLGSDDSLTLYYGSDIVDFLDWESDDAPVGYSYGRLPDGSVEAQTLTPTPNLPNKPILDLGLVINEIMAKDSYGGNDWIELYVVGDNPINLGNYSIVDDTEGREPTVLDDIDLLPGDFLVIQATDEVSDDTGLYVPFKLSSNDSLSLYNGTNIIDFLDWKSGDAPSGVSYGLLPDGVGDAQSLTPTPGAANRAFNVFDTNRVVEVEFEISDESWQEMLANPMAEEFKEGSIIYNGIRIEDVAIRIKGNSSLMTVARDITNNRYSFKVDLNLYEKGQDLAGLQKLNFNNGFSDPTFMREHISYKLMREFGLPAPRTAFVNLYINDELMGLYTVVEQVDDEFVETRFENGAGDLYKPEGIGGDLLWRGESIEDYPGIELKTNEDTSDHSALLTMLNELNNGSNLESVIDVDEVLRYIVVSTTLVNLDSYQGRAANYYLYETDGIFSIIPWDLNMSFAGFNMGGCDRDQLIGFMIDEPTIGNLSDRPLIAKLLADPYYIAMYHSYIDQFITGLFSPENMDKIIDETANLIRDHVYADPTKFYTEDEFEDALVSDLSENPSFGLMDLGLNNEQEPIRDVSGDIAFGRMGFGLIIGLKDFVYERVASIRDQLNGFATSSGDGSGNCEGNFFGGMDPFNFDNAIVDINPSYARQGDVDINVVITLNEQMMMFSSWINLLNVKIGTLEGNNISYSYNDLEINASFNIPENEPIGMKDVSVEFEQSENFIPQNMGEIPGGFVPPDGFAPPDGFVPWGGFKPPDGFVPPDGFIPGGGFMPPEGFVPPDGFVPGGGFIPPDGFQNDGLFPDGGFQVPFDRNFIFTKPEAFEIRANAEYSYDSTVTLNLKTGYNLFALPPFEIFYDENGNQILNYDAKILLNEIGPGSEIYNWSDEDQQWKSPCTYEYRDRDNFSLKLGKSYFLFISKDLEYTFKGIGGIYKTTAVDIDFFTGYNLVSPHNPNRAFNSLDLLNDLDNIDIEIYRFDNERQMWESGESDFNIKTGEGYFIYAPNSMKWPKNPQIIN